MTDYLLNKKVKLNQPVNSFRTGLDTVLLAMVAPKIKSGNICDMGAGVGALGLCYLTRLVNNNIDVDKINITGVEKSEVFTQYYSKNIDCNKFKNNFNIINNDIVKTDLKKSSFDMVITNPPFEKNNTYKSDNDLKNIANIESTCDLQSWIKTAVNITKQNGYIAIVHKMERLDEILHYLHPNIGAIRILPIITKVGFQPKRVIVIGVKNSKSSLKMHNPLILSDDTKQYTDFTNKILFGEMEIDLYKKD